MQATALSARLENLRDRRLEAFALAGCTSPARSPCLFCEGASERRSLNIGRCSARVGNYSRTTARFPPGPLITAGPHPITWVSKAGGSPTRRPGENAVGRPEGQDAQSERPDVAIQYEELLGKSGEWRLGNDDANEHDKKQHREPSEGCQEGLPHFPIAACLKDEEISTLPPVKSPNPRARLANGRCRLRLLVALLAGEYRSERRSRPHT